MKKIFLTIIALSALAAISSSCDSYLDQQPIDKEKTAEDIFTKQASTTQYLNRLFNYVPEYYLISSTNGEPWGPISDEAEVSFGSHASHKMNKGAWSPSATFYAKLDRCYNMIRDCNYFLKYVDMCKELGDEMISQYKAEARFLRAYYNFLLVRLYGAIPLLGDKILSPDDNCNIGRSSFTECVEYISNELMEVSEILYVAQSSSRLGHPTRGAALALRARLLLYAASELYNPSTPSNAIYKNWVSNTTGEELMPTSYDASKWQTAADACKIVIDSLVISNPVYQLYVQKTGDDIDPYKSLYGLYTEPWNSETIFGRVFAGGASYSWYRRITPRAVTNGWGGYSPTQKQVDAFAMANGIYPIRSYVGASENGESAVPVIDPASGYSETGCTENYEHPFDHLKADTYNMYVGREPRFYIDVTWDGMKFPHSVVDNVVSSFVEVQCYYGGNSGAVNDNRSANGYIVRKMQNRANKSPLLQNTENYQAIMVWPMIRLGEIYLDYVEALIEIGDLTNPDIWTYWNAIRERAGVPDIRTVYPDVVSDQSLAREMIRRERQVELCFENARYFDTKRWMIMEETNNGYTYGMDVSQKTDKPIGTANFWKRTPLKDFDERVFTKANYMFPIPNNEVERNTMFEQSPFYK